MHDSGAPPTRGGTWRKASLTGASEKLLYIDALRGWAILLVILVHAALGQIAIRSLDTASTGISTGLSLPAWVTAICMGGGNGVTLFFVVSALSLCLSDFYRPCFDLTSFALRRYFRIAPMFYIAGAVYLLLFGWGPRMWATNGIDLADVVSTLLLAHIWRDNAMNSVVPGGWSIGVEVMFYVVLPIVLPVARRSLWFTLILSVAVFTTSQLYFIAASASLSWKPIHWLGFPNQSACFFAGISAAALLHHRNIKSFPAWVPSLLLVAMIVVLPQFTSGQTVFESQFRFAIMAGVLCVMLHRTRANFVANHMTAAVGRVSFSMYLTHFALMEPLWRLTQLFIAERGLLFLTFYYFILVLLSFFISIFSYRWIEAPFIHLSHTLTYVRWASRY